MTIRIERKSKHKDAKAATLRENLKKAGVSAVDRVDNFTIDYPLLDDKKQEIKLDDNKKQEIARMLVNPVVEQASIDKYLAPNNFDWAIEVGFLPGVTDCEGTTVTKEISDKFKEQPPVYTSQTFFFSGVESEEQVKQIAETLYNPIIQHARIKAHDAFVAEKGMGAVVPRVKLVDTRSADIVELFIVDKKGNYVKDIDDEELIRIGKEGIANKDGTRRGTLSMDLPYMKAVQKHFKKLGHNPTDVELEAVAQSWSEHCKHTIFADPIDEIKDGLFKTYIVDATERIVEIWKEKGRKNFLGPVFKDNSGIIEFDENYYLTDKAETHNTPSALDPDGGSETGIGGVERDSVGTGLGARPFVGGYYYCCGNPDDKRKLFRNKEITNKMLSPRRHLDGIVRGVNKYGNSMGIPTTQGGICFDDRYRGKPLVFVRSVGIMPKTIAGRPSQEKRAKDGDHIVVLGGRVGKDGIHGATFSSESLHSGSPSGAVQIGAPITQKNAFDALFEIQDRGLYTSITDFGAGGLSCAVGEMAKESGGCVARLENVLLKYDGLRLDEIWISEAQERMLISVPPDKWDELKAHMDKRGVEASVIGSFTSSDRCTVTYCDKSTKKESTIMDLDMNFLHDGLPKIQQESTYTRPKFKVPDLPNLENMTESLHKMLSRQNIASHEFISRQYDHEVQGGSVLKPLQGKGRINGDATITRPVLTSKKGVVLSQGINPLYSDLDTYNMAACAIDTAIRNAIVAGANPDHLALMDNFCWCSSREKERLGQLKAACEACYNYSIAYETPFISGKDSMFNDFKGFDENGNPIKISVPPTLLISSIGVIDDVSKAVSLDAKCAGDLVYVIGSTLNELGGSEYLNMIGQHMAGRVPAVPAEHNAGAYRAFAKCVDEELIESAQSVNRGGLAVALAKKAMGGRLGMKVSFNSLSGSYSDNHDALYSESTGRIIVTIRQENKGQFEKLMEGGVLSQIGVITSENDFIIEDKDKKKIINTKVDAMLKSYRSTFEGY